MTGDRDGLNAAQVAQNQRREPVTAERLLDPLIDQDEFDRRMRERWEDIDGGVNTPMLRRLCEDRGWILEVYEDRWVILPAAS